MMVRASVMVAKLTESGEVGVRVRSSNGEYVEMGQCCKGDESMLMLES